MSKHTKGPWRVEVTPDSLEVVSVITTSFGSVHTFVVADCNVMATELMDVNESVTLANARLIASAPLMLEALRVAVKRMEEIRYQIASDKQINFLKEVIARAEGHE
jgi:hypothetical protein